MPFRLFAVILFMLLGFLGCKSPESRRPTQQSTGSSIEASVARNIKRFAAEVQAIETYIAQDTTHAYQTSADGFWYAYDLKVAKEAPTPVTGSEVSFSYEVKDLNGLTILSYDQVGTVQYLVDQSKQDLISGIREGIKLMKAQEIITLVLPSYKAYGYYGLEGKIGANTPIVVSLKLNQMSNLDN